MVMTRCCCSRCRRVSVLHCVLFDGNRGSRSPKKLSLLPLPSRCRRHALEVGVLLSLDKGIQEFVTPALRPIPSDLMFFVVSL